MEFEKCNIPMYIIQCQCDKLNEVINEIERIYYEKATYFNYSDLLPKLNQIALEKFMRTRNIPFYFCEKEVLMESLARKRVEPLRSYELYFKNEAKRILDSKTEIHYKKADSLSQLLNDAFEAIDDLRIWGITYAEKTGQAISKVFLPEKDESLERNMARVSILSLDMVQ